MNTEVIGHWRQASVYTPAELGLYWTRDVKTGRRSAKVFEYWPGMSKNVWRHANTILEVDPNTFEWLEESVQKNATVDQKY